MKARIAFTIMILLASLIFHIVYAQYEGPAVASAGISQLNGDTHEYVIGRAISQGAIKKTADAFAVVLLIVIWLPLIYRYYKTNSD